MQCFSFYLLLIFIPQKLAQLIMIEQNGMVELVGVPQNYDWGIQGRQSLVASLHKSNTGVEIDEGKPYAELWMGTHPNGPSTLKNGQPLKEYLGKGII